MQTKTSPGPGFGIGSSRSCSGAVPTSAVRARTIAFIIDCSQEDEPTSCASRQGQPYWLLLGSFDSTERNEPQCDIRPNYAGCSKRPSSKAAASEGPRRTLGVR